jgi:transposase-like protein
MPAEKGNKYATGNKGGGRETAYKNEYTKTAYSMCLLGATDKELANCFEVSEQTINVWKNKHEEFNLALKQGKIEADSIVAQKLYHRAIGYEHPEIITASYQGQITDTMTVTKHYAPDPTAAIFWLKNRQPDKWRDKQELDLGNKDGKPFEISNMTDAEIEKKLAELGYSKQGKTE